MNENEEKEEQNKDIGNTSSVEKKKLNIFGLVSFIFSIVGILIGGILIGMAGIILGTIGTYTFKKDKQKCRWMGIAGICLGVVAIIGGILYATTFV